MEKMVGYTRVSTAEEAEYQLTVTLAGWRQPGSLPNDQLGSCPLLVKRSCDREFLQRKC